MLVITRKANESILINDNVEISVLEITKDKVRIGVNAPRDIKIIRSELAAVQNTNVEASKAVSPNVLNEIMKLKRGQNHD